MDRVVAARIHVLVVSNATDIATVPQPYFFDNQVRDAIEKLYELDREVILLRHVEALTNAEVAELLEIDPATARKRHGRAIRRLGE